MTKIQLPLITSDENLKRVFFAETNFDDPKKLYYFLKDTTKKHPYYFLPVHTIPYTTVIDTLGRYLWGLKVKHGNLSFFGAVKIVLYQKKCQIFIPDYLPEQAKELLIWALKQIPKRSKNDS